MSNSRNPLVKLWTGFWKVITWLRIATLNLLFLLVLFLVLSAVFSPARFAVPESGPLVLMPSGYLVDQKSYQSPTLSLMGASTEYPAETLVRELVDSILVAAQDESVTALVLELDHLAGAGVSKLEEVGQALATFKKESDKPIIAVADSYSQSQYYLASYADEIYLNNMGAVLLTGFGMYQHYFAEGLDKLDVNVHIFRAGEYKDAVEPFIRNSMSSSSREHNSRWINELWGVYTSRIETARQLPAGAVNQFINDMPALLEEKGGNSAQLALDYGLVDHVMPSVDIHARLIERFGIDPSGETYLGIPHRPYITQHRMLEPARPDQIALIVAVGTILDGEQPTGAIGSDTLSRLIRQAREDEKVKALVLRIDSGGGSAFASEEIRQELAATRAQGKPVIISMSSLAASGGYWISLPADEIWAAPTTLTGSIGVFGVFPTIEKTLENLGIHTDGIGTTELADSNRIDQKLSPKAAEVAQTSVQFIYQRFLQLVADARGQTVDQIHDVGQGRVWTGATAAELGLVDKLGYLNDAIAAAATTAGIEDYSVELIERELTPTEQIMRALSGNSQSMASAVQRQLLAMFVGERTALLPDATRLNEVRQQLQDTAAPLLQPDKRGIYSQCLQCGRL